MHQYSSHPFSLVAEANPLKQGLKHRVELTWTLSKYVAEANPLKQGLKQNAATSFFLRALVAEANPLKQGLKQKSIPMLLPVI